MDLGRLGTNSTRLLSHLSRPHPLPDRSIYYLPTLSQPVCFWAVRLPFFASPHLHHHLHQSIPPQRPRTTRPSAAQATTLTGSNSNSNPSSSFSIYPLITDNTTIILSNLELACRTGPRRPWQQGRRHHSISTATSTHTTLLSPGRPRDHTTRRRHRQTRHLNRSRPALIIKPEDTTTPAWPQAGRRRHSASIRSHQRIRTRPVGTSSRLTHR